jgi:hypothetical protein
MFLNFPAFVIEYITIYIKALLHKLCSIFTLARAHLPGVFKTAIFLI